MGVSAENFSYQPEAARRQEPATFRDFVVNFFRSLALGRFPSSQAKALNTSERHQEIKAAHAEMSKLKKSIYESTTRLLSHYKIGPSVQNGLKDQVTVADQQIDLAISTDKAMGIIWIVFTQSDVLPEEEKTDTRKTVKHTACRLELHIFRGPQGKPVYEIFSLEVNDRVAHLTTQPGVIINSELKVADQMYRTFEAELLNLSRSSIGIL